MARGTYIDVQSKSREREVSDEVKMCFGRNAFTAFWMRDPCKNSREEDIGES